MPSDTSKLYEEHCRDQLGPFVTTDMPLAIDRPIDFGLQDFCSKCKKCAREG